MRLQLLKHVPRPLADLHSRTTYHEELFPSPRAPVNIPLPFAEVIFWLTTSPYWSNYQGVVCREIEMGCKQGGGRKGGEGGGQGGVKEEERWGKCICVEFGYRMPLRFDGWFTKDVRLVIFDPLMSSELGERV